MKYIASCSFGKDSLAMVLKILEKGLPLDEVIFFDTGMEFDSIYKNCEELRKVLFKHSVPFAQLKPDMPFIYTMLVKPIKFRDKSGKPYPYHYGHEWCGGQINWNTSTKLLTIQNHYKNNYFGEQIVEYVGIAEDELERTKKNQSGKTIKEYPLIEWGMKEKDCLEFCRETGWNWHEKSPVPECGFIDLYDILDRVSCWCCRNKNLKELKNMYIYLPQYWERLRGLQSRIDKPMKGPGKSVFDLEERFKREIAEEDKNGIQMELFDFITCDKCKKGYGMI